MRTIPALIAFLGLAPTAQAAEDLHAALGEIADAIVERAPDGSTVGVSTITHSDGTCSELTNFVSETVMDSLFGAAAGRVSIIERSQLSAIFREMELVYDGTIAPDAARRLGEIQGVEAIVTGRVVTFGESVQLLARLIGTEDGTVFATARSEFPLIDTVRTMMAERSRDACGFAPPPGAHAETEAAERPRPEGGTVFSSDVFGAEIMGLHYAPATGDASASIRFRNISDEPIALSYLSKTLAVADGAGGMMTLKDTWSGIRRCGSHALGGCTSAYPKDATTIAAGKVAQLNFDLEGASDLEDPALTLSMEFVVTPNAADVDSFDVRTVSFFDVEPSVR